MKKCFKEFQHGEQLHPNLGELEILLNVLNL